TAAPPSAQTTPPAPTPEGVGRGVQTSPVSQGGNVKLQSVFSSQTSPRLPETLGQGVQTSPQQLSTTCEGAVSQTSPSLSAPHRWGEAVEANVVPMGRRASISLLMSAETQTQPLPGLQEKGQQGVCPLSPSPCCGEAPSPSPCGAKPGAALEALDTTATCCMDMHGNPPPPRVSPDQRQLTPAHNSPQCPRSVPPISPALCSHEEEESTLVGVGYSSSPEGLTPSSASAPRGGLFPGAGVDSFDRGGSGVLHRPQILPNQPSPLSVGHSHGQGGSERAGPGSSHGEEPATAVVAHVKGQSRVVAGGPPCLADERTGQPPTAPTAVSASAHIGETDPRPVPEMMEQEEEAEGKPGLARDELTRGRHSQGWVAPSRHGLAAGVVPESQQCSISEGHVAEPEGCRGDWDNAGGEGLPLLEPTEQTAGAGAATPAQKERPGIPVPGDSSPGVVLSHAPGPCDPRHLEDQQTISGGGSGSGSGTTSFRSHSGVGNSYDTWETIQGTDTCFGSLSPSDAGGRSGKWCGNHGCDDSPSLCSPPRWRGKLRQGMGQ
ncbi:unnamed protein product, partial [Discosporangium mesarthrocarpum]